MKNKLPTIIHNGLESLGNFIKATVEQKPLLYLFEKAEKGIHKTITQLEKYSEQGKVKHQEKKRIKQQIAEREAALSHMQYLPKEIFFKRLKALKERFPIKNLNQEIER